MIEIVAYDTSWPAAFEAEATLLRSVLGPRALSIDHVGSTAVSGLAAKPVIDIQVSVEPLHPIDGYRAALASLGYQHVDLGDFDRVYPYFEKPGTWPHTHHVHLCRLGSREERVHLAFRDHLRRHPHDAARYVELKRRLAAGMDGSSRESREQYSLSKSEFVQEILTRGRCRRERRPVQLG